MAKQGKAAQEFIPIKEIRDGAVRMKDNSLRVVLMVSSLNFALKSPDEQTSVLLQFQNFFNSLDFSTQIFIQSRRLDIKPYIELLKNRMDEQGSELIKIQTREYIEFVKNFTDSVNIMSKNFFVVIPYYADTMQITKSGFLSGIFGGGKEEQTEEENFESQKMQLEQRAVIVEQGLAASGLRSARLGTEELIELYYKIFNPGEKSGAPQTEELAQAHK